MKSENKLRVFRLVLAWATVVFAPIAMAQTSSVELLGTVTAAQASNGLGFNLDENNEWEWAAAAAAGATYARIQCSWDLIEQQTAPPNNKAAATQYVQAPGCVNAFAYAAKYGITPIVTAGYGPPYHKILGVTVPGGAAVGATAFTIEFKEGVGGDTLSSLSVPYDYFCPAAIAAPVATPAVVCGSYVSGSQSPEGALIRSVTQLDSSHAKITLASALVTSLPEDDTLYNISEILYPATATERANDSSVVAYANYVSFLANDMAARGLKGQIELWNEPPLSADPWDNSCLLYDPNSGPCPIVPGSAPSRGSPNYGFVANLQQRAMPEGITATWNGTSGSGWASFLGPRMFAQSGAYATEPATVVTKESFHPYGYEPEEMMWTTACLEATVIAKTKAGQNFNNCYLPGEPPTPNFAWAVQADMIEKAINPAYGAGHEITETGILPPADGYQVQQARFVMRQFLGFEAIGVTPINFFKLYDGGALQEPNFSFVEEAGNTPSYTAKPSYTAISGFLADLNPVSSPPITASSSATLPAVISYTGTYPLTTVHMVGSRSGASSNSDIFAVWQRSFTNCTSNCDSAWITQASPAAGPVTVSIPTGMKVTQLVNLTTRDVVLYTTSANNISFMVADDPIEVLVDPISSTATGGPKKPTKMILSTSAATSTYSQPVVLTAALGPYKSGDFSTDGQNVVFLNNGTTQIGTATLVSGVATMEVGTIPAGVNTIVAHYAGDAHFVASSGYTSVTVAKADPALTILAISPLTYGSATFPVSPATNSPGAISLTVLSGPAHMATGNSSGGTVAILGAGTVVLGATQVPTANYYAGGLVSRSFVVNAEEPVLVFQSFAPKTYGNAPFPVGAKSASHGKVSFSVLSGPATILGSTVTLTGAGTVVLEASQQASGNYLATTTTLTFIVAKAIPTLNFKPIAPQTFGSDSFAVTATSASSGVASYSIVSGPAKVSGNMVTLTGIGTVSVGAKQATTANYSAVSRVTSFVVNPGKPVIVFEGFAPKTYGDNPFPITAKSKSHGIVVLSIAKGPATVSGSLVTITGAGTVVVQASQPAQGNYASTTSSLRFVVAQAAPTLTMPAIATQIYGAKPFPVVPSTNSPGAVSLTVISGPAHILTASSTGGTVAILGAGTVVLGATQVPTKNYLAGTWVTTQFTVSPEAPVLTFGSFAAKKYGMAPFPISAKSASHGSVSYSIVSGSATVSGSIITITGTGTVVVEADQQAYGSYSAATAMDTFVVAPGL